MPGSGTAGCGVASWLTAVRWSPFFTPPTFSLPTDHFVFLAAFSLLKSTKRHHQPLPKTLSPPTTAKNPLPSSLTKNPLPSSLTRNPTISNLIGAMELPRSPARFTVGGPMLNMVFEAAFDGDLPRFKSLLVMLDKGGGRLKETVEALRVKDPWLLEGLGAVHVAACRERLEVCKYLIEDLQVDVNGVDKGGNGEAVKLLLAKGAYVDPIASCGTPLHCAASKGHDDIMKILLDHNADCNKLVNGKTPLNTAGDANSKNCIYLLLKAGADRKAPLTYATEKLQSEKVISADFVNCIMGDVTANSILPDDDEPQSKRKIRAAGFQKLASFSFKEEYLSAAMSYTVDQATRKTLYRRRCVGGLYPLIPELRRSNKQACGAIKLSSTRWHDRLGHASFSLVEKLLRKNKLPFVGERHNETICDSCQRAKSHQLPYPVSTSVSTKHYSCFFLMFGVLLLIL